MRRLFALAAAALMVVASAATAAEWKKVLAPAELAALAGEGGVTVIDIRPPREYLTAHVPGAINAPYPAWRGPAENPGAPLTDAALTQLLRGLGLTAESRAVVTHAGIDATDFGAAARVYWTLKSAGLTEIAILNGGVRGWIVAGRELSVTPSAAKPSKASFTLSGDWMADRDTVAAIVAGEREATLVDARPDPFRTGKKAHPAAKAPGTLPGSQQVLFDSWFEKGGPEIGLVDKVKALAEAEAPGAGGETVSFCNTGHWAAINWFALSEMAGRENVRLYPESMVGWTGAGGKTATVE